VLDAPRDTHLDGYWQSEKYFQDIAATIRRDFTLATDLSAQDRAVADAIADVNAVSVHVRRGDYVTDARTRAAHGVCSNEYYLQACDMIIRRQPDPHFFVFSDDLDWCRSHLQLPGAATYVGHNGPDRDYADLYLMSQCRNHIIANSSFSWWGAWLNPRSDKVVIAPCQWFSGLDVDTRDVLPDGWIRI
jgi:hypothetical protein